MTTKEPEAGWVESFNSQFVGEDGRMSNANHLIVKDFIQQQIEKALVEGGKLGFKAGHTAALSRIEEEVEGMEEEDTYSPAYADYTPEKAVTNSQAILNYNRALTDIKAIISKIREEYGN